LKFCNSFLEGLVTNMDDSHFIDVFPIFEVGSNYNDYSPKKLITIMGNIIRLTNSESTEISLTDSGRFNIQENEIFDIKTCSGIYYNKLVQFVESLLVEFKNILQVYLEEINSDSEKSTKPLGEDKLVGPLPGAKSPVMGDFATGDFATSAFNFAPQSPEKLLQQLQKMTLENRYSQLVNLLQKVEKNIYISPDEVNTILILISLNAELAVNLPQNLKITLKQMLNMNIQIEQNLLQKIKPSIDNVLKQLGGKKNKRTKNKNKQTKNKNKRTKNRNKRTKK